MGITLKNGQKQITIPLKKEKYILIYSLCLYFLALTIFSSFLFTLICLIALKYILIAKKRVVEENILDIVLIGEMISYGIAIFILFFGYIIDISLIIPAAIIFFVLQLYLLYIIMVFFKNSRSYEISKLMLEGYKPVKEKETSKIKKLQKDTQYNIPLLQYDHKKARFTYKKLMYIMGLMLIFNFILILRF